MSTKYSQGEIQRQDIEVERAIHALQHTTHAREMAAGDHRRAAEAEASAEQRYDREKAKAAAMRAENAAVSS